MTFGLLVERFPTPSRKVKYRYLEAKPRFGSEKCSAYSTRYFPLPKQRATPPAHFLQKDKRLCSSRSLFLFGAVLTKSLTSYFPRAVINRASFLNNDPRRPFGQKRRVFSTRHQTTRLKLQTPPREQFEPRKGKYRRQGTGWIHQVSKNVWEGRYSPIVNGKRIIRNVYASSIEECEQKLARMIAEMKEEYGIA